VLPLGIREGANKRQLELKTEQVEALEKAALVEKTVAKILFDNKPTPLQPTTGDALSLCNLPDRDVPAHFDEMYCRSIHETIREELDEEGGNRQIAVKSFYVSRHLEVLAQSLGLHPRRIAQAAAERNLLQDGLLRSTTESVIFYCVGSLYGRWDLRFVVGTKASPSPPNPFDPLPICSPGMLQGPDGLPAKEVPGNYPFRINWDGIISDDFDQPDNLIRRVQEVLELIWKDRAEAIEKEACEILGVKELRDYFRKPGKGGFWDDHVTRYSKSRRKAPIYWLLQSSKRNYALWLYYHRLDKETLLKALLPKGPVQTKINREQSRLDELRRKRKSAESDAKTAKKLDKEIEQQEDLLNEIKDFAEKLERAAKLEFGDKDKLNSNIQYNPDLNDGVVLNIAPLHELVPWKEAKKYWDELLEGKYEWSSMGKLLRMKGLVKC
jgi:hypothetical protein